MAAAGERFEVNLDSDSDDASSSAAAPPLPLSFNFVKDIVERDPSAAEPPAAPQLKGAATGFPEHKKRAPRVSRFKQKNAANAVRSSVSSQPVGADRAQVPLTNLSPEEQERIQADRDSQQALASMSRDEIEEQRRELLAGEVPGVTSSLIERLLKRAAINEDVPNPMTPPEQKPKEQEDTEEGDVFEYEASDSGNLHDAEQQAKLLDDSGVPRKVSLRKGSQVRLTKAMDDNTAAGTVGKVIDFTTLEKHELHSKGSASDTSASAAERLPLVRFKLANGTTRDLLCTRQSFDVTTTEGATDGTNQVSRSQIPLILATTEASHGGEESNTTSPSKKTTKPTKNVSFADAPPSPPQPPASQPQPSFKPLTHDPNAAPLVPPPDLRPATSKAPFSRESLPPPPTTHFPAPSAPPDLDPSSPNFLTELQQHYFPNLAPDPSSLSWMAPLASTPSETSYSPAAASLAPSELRFDFRGRLLPPNLAHQLPATLGLHHHGAAPEAAGYTLPELATMCRSVLPAQRCVAYQTLGRILYRLGKGVFGPEDGELYEGLWKLVEGGKVLELMIAEAEGGGETGRGSRSAWAVATEAVWNWRMGGGKRWVAK